MYNTFQALFSFINEKYPDKKNVSLHEPLFQGNEKKYVENTIDSSYVSSVGEYVNKFESLISQFTSSDCAVATVNGTAALHTALMASGVVQNDYVITQSLSFVATCNAINYCGAEPIFVDIEKKTLGLSPQKLLEYLNENAFIDDDGHCRIRSNNRIIKACVPMHTFGHPANILKIIEICNIWQITLIEDAAESLGSTYNNKHTGTFGRFGTLSFNGNKTITTGAGGMILCNKKDFKFIKHITTTAKTNHKFEFIHDMVGYNYRMPNINAALGCAQLENIDIIIKKKRQLAAEYIDLISNTEMLPIIEPDGAKSNYWLNAAICPDKAYRDQLLKSSHAKNIMLRPVWRPMHQLPMHINSKKGDLSETEKLSDLLINLPSSAPQ
jgi:aminotransferase in exopolysaccharide biosynthesis